MSADPPGTGVVLELIEDPIHGGEQLRTSWIALQAPQRLVSLWLVPQLGHGAIMVHCPMGVVHLCVNSE